MQRFIITAALALALVALWAVILPMTAQQLSGGSSPTMSKALFLCRTQRGIDQTCVTALAKALIIEQPERDSMVATDLACHADARESAKPGARP
jgi:hypothetical protein